MRIYTRTGDGGSTGLFGGLRVSKANQRVEAYGTLDEASACVGWARVAGPSPEVDDVLADVQDTCFRLGAWLASAPGRDPGIPPLGAADVEAVERSIDRFDAGLPPLQSFIVPGGCEVGARLHVARTVARRAERALVELSQVEPVAPPLLAWMNRLSDLLFVLARVENHRARTPETPWRPRANDPA